MIDAVVHDAGEVFVGTDESPESGEGGAAETTSRSGPTVVADAAVAVADGRVVAVGPTDAVTREYPPENAVVSVDAGGRAVLPGFVDAHTHALFAGDRSDEFAAKLRGTTYQEILAEGGGILRTVRAVREATDERLLGNLLGHLDVMLAHGTTTVEVKSGYGLDLETELRMLDVLDRADDRHPVDVVPTFMGAHAVPQDRDVDGYVDEVVEEHLPAVADQGIADFCDVFCEEGAFSVAQSRRVLAAGRDRGLAPKVHAEELTRLGGAALAADVGATSADHLLHATDEDATALAEAGVTAVLLPGTAFSLGASYADPATFADAGATVAIATDFNPNCHSQSMGMAAALACAGMRMSPADAVAAATHGGASALGLAGGTGTLREGAPGDLVVIDGPSHVHVPYSFGVNRVATVCKRGEVVHDADGLSRGTGASRTDDPARPDGASGVSPSPSGGSDDA